MFDTHCHADLYPNPEQIVEDCERLRLYTVAVTNAPSVFPASEKLAAKRDFVRAALGLHPQLAIERRGELPLFERALDRTRFVGEVGLDYTVCEADRRIQRQVFTEILRLCHQARDKILTIHSRRASEDVVDAIGEDFDGRAVLHWYSGSLKVLRRAVSYGLYFSVNPAMASGGRFDTILVAIPPDRVLLESDGPFVKVGNRPAAPADVAKVVRRISELWGCPRARTERRLMQNFRDLLATTRPSP